MNLGPHAALVEEVLRFARSGGVLRRSATIQPEPPIYRLTGFGQLAKLADEDDEADPEEDVVPLDLWPEQPRNYMHSAPADLTAQPNATRLWTGRSWDMLLRLQFESLIKVHWTVVPGWAAIRNALDERFRESRIEAELRERADEVLPRNWGDYPFERTNKIQELVECWMSDLHLCAEYRAFAGAADGFWERLFQVYLCGHYPCGWYGVYPTPGCFVVIGVP